MASQRALLIAAFWLLASVALAQSGAFPTTIPAGERAELFAVVDKLGYRAALSGPVYMQGENVWFGAWDFMLRTTESGKTKYRRFNWRRAELFYQPTPYPTRSAMSMALESCRSGERIYGDRSGFVHPTVLDAILWARFADLHGETKARDQFLEAALRKNLWRPLRPDQIRRL